MCESRHRSETVSSGKIGPQQIVAVVLAGGFGTRIRHLLPGLPKPMAPVADRPFLEWVVRYLGGQGITRVVLSTGYLSEVIEAHFAAQPVPRVVVQCVRETEPLGTAGGFLNAAAAFADRPEAWLVLNGDSLILGSLAAAIGSFDEGSVEGVMIGCPVRDASRYGTLAIRKDGRLLGFEEKRPGQGVINAGVYLLRDGLVGEFPSQRPLSFEKDVFPQWVQRGVFFKVVETQAPFLDIGTPESLREAQSFVQEYQHWFQPGQVHE
jgi:D-glycero-alpha-D-manno-heptose 1-phosphate guanylyltransferase